MSASKLKHRHDIGHPYHGAKSTESVTRAIQFVLGTSIVATVALVIYAMLAR